MSEFFTVFIVVGYFYLFLFPGRLVYRPVPHSLRRLHDAVERRHRGPQAFSLSFAGFMHYHLPIVPHNLETYKEGLLGALTVVGMPFVLFWFINKIVPRLKFAGSDLK